MESRYNIVTVGTGIRELFTAGILFCEEYSLCVAEKNNKWGGSLQSFAINKILYNAGFYYTKPLRRYSEIIP